MVHWTLALSLLFLMTEGTAVGRRVGVEAARHRKAERLARARQAQEEAVADLPRDTTLLAEKLSPQEEQVADARGSDQRYPGGEMQRVRRERKLGEEQLLRREETEHIRRAEATRERESAAAARAFRIRKKQRSAF